MNINKKNLLLKNVEYVSGWQEKYNTLFVDAIARATIKYPQIIGNNVEEYYSFIDRTNYVEVYYTKKAQEAIDITHGHYFTNKRRINGLLKNYDRIIKQYNYLLKSCQKIV